jgi:hypothetical protein
LDPGTQSAQASCDVQLERKPPLNPKAGMGTREAYRQRVNHSTRSELGKQHLMQARAKRPRGIVWPCSDLTGMSSSKASYNQVGSVPSHPLYPIYDPTAPAPSVSRYMTRVHYSYMTWIYDTCLYKLEQLASSDDTKYDSKMYWVPCNAHACLLVYSYIYSISIISASKGPKIIQFLYY